MCFNFFIFYLNPCLCRFSMPKIFVDYPPPTYKLHPKYPLECSHSLSSPRYLSISPPPTYKLHPKYPLEVDAVPLGRIIAEFPRMIFSSLKKMKRKLMVGVDFVLFVITAIAQNGGSHIIAVLIESCAEIIFMRSCLTVRFFLFKSWRS